MNRLTDEERQEELRADLQRRAERAVEKTRIGATTGEVLAWASILPHDAIHDRGPVGAIKILGVTLVDAGGEPWTLGAVRSLLRLGGGGALPACNTAGVSSGERSASASASASASVGRDGGGHVAALVKERIQTLDRDIARTEADIEGLSGRLARDQQSLAGALSERAALRGFLGG